MFASVLIPFTHIFILLQILFDMQCSIFFSLEVFFTIGYLVAIQYWVCPDYKRLVFENECHLSFGLWVFLSSLSLGYCRCQHQAMLLTYIWFPCILYLRTLVSLPVDSGLVSMCLVLGLSSLLFSTVFYPFLCCFLLSSFPCWYLYQVGFIIHISSDTV